MLGIHKAAEPVASRLQIRSHSVISPKVYFGLTFLSALPPLCMAAIIPSVLSVYPLCHIWPQVMMG